MQKKDVAYTVLTVQNFNVLCTNVKVYWVISIYILQLLLHPSYSCVDNV